MRSAYIIVRILLVVLIMVLIINFLLVFNPFSAGKVLKDTETPGIEEPKPEDRVNIPMESDTDGEPEKDEEIIGYTDLESSGDSANTDPDGYVAPDENNDYYLTYEEIISIGNISMRDKLFGLYLLRKTGKGDLEKVLRIADGGITYEEWNKLAHILKQDLSSKDMERLKKIIEKNKKLYDEGKLASK